MPVRCEPVRRIWSTTAEGQVFSAATKIKADDQTGLWILQLSDSGHGLTGLTFARTALQAAAPLHAVNFQSVAARSGLRRFPARSPDAHRTPSRSSADPT